MNRYFVLLAASWLSLALQSAGQGTVFTYQGRLTDGTNSFTGSAEFQPTLWNDPTAGSQIAANTPATLIVSVNNGLFVLPLDFGSAPLSAGSDRWLQLQVRTTIGAFTTLTPRQKLNPTPYAIYSANAATANTALSANSVSAANITGQLGLAQLPPTVVTNTQAGLSLTGSFTGNGGGLSNLSPTSLVLVGTNRSIVAWGWNLYGQRSIPEGLDDVIALSGGAAHSLALRANGTVVAWGAGKTNNSNSGADFGQSIVPDGLNGVSAISAGYLHSLALRANGLVVAWGYNVVGQTNVPAGLNNVMAISAGYLHNVVLKRDGTVSVWGTNDQGQLNVPAGLNDVKAVSAGLLHSLALRSNGTVVAWGSNLYGVTNIPVGLNNVIAISAGGVHNMALKGDGTVVVWGTNDFGQLDIPLGLNNVIGISAGLQQCAALKADGTVVAWGHNEYGSTNVPPNLNNVMSLAPTFGYHYLALRRKSQAPVAWLDSDNTFNGNIQVNGDLRAFGEVIAGGGLRLNDQNLWLRGAGDFKNGLGWYGDTKGFGNGTPSGPVLFGDMGGALGTSGTNGFHVALRWDNFERVTIGNEVYSLAPTLRFGSSGYGITATNSQLRFYLSGSGNRFSFFDSFNGTELFTIQPNGFNGANVGIGTPSPNSRLDVRGEIRFGSSGQYSTVGGNESLRIIRGIVNGAGAILSGTGFTVTKGPVGYFTINFSPTFSDAPAVTVTAQSGIDRIATCTSVSGSATGIWTRDSAGNPTDNQFNFIAVGAR